MGDNEINRLFEKFEIANKLFQRDGAVDETLYAAADVKILWVLKQDWVGPDPKYGDSFCERIKGLAKDKCIQVSPTWRRMAQVSYGMLHDVTNFDDLPECNECADALLSTAIIEANKEIGDTRSPNSIVLNGFNKYRELIFKQIDALKPDVILVAMSSEELKPIPGGIYCHLNGKGPYEESLYEAEWDRGDNIASSCVGSTILLWVCHPQATSDRYGGVDDASYFSKIMNRYNPTGGKSPQHNGVRHSPEP